MGDAAPTAFLPVTAIGELGLWIAAALTIYTGYDYLATGLKHVDEEEPVRPSAEGAAQADAARRSA